MKDIINSGEVNELIFREFVKNGFARNDGHKSWDVAKRRFLYLTPEQANSFLNLKSFDVYKKQIIEREIKLIHEHGKNIAENIGGEPFNLIDIFCGDGTKACEIIKLFPKNVKIRYCPVNASKYLIDIAISNVKAANLPNVIEFKPMLAQGDGQTLRYLDSNLKGGRFKRNVVIILGTVLASFQITEYLFEMSKDMSVEDFLIIGNGIRMGKRLVELGKYRAPQLGNWSIHLVSGLGLRDDEVEYDVRFGNSRVEMFFRILVDKTIKHDGKTLEFKKGDEILTMVLYKYYAKEFDKFCKMYFSNVNLWTDKDNGYALVMCNK